MILRLSNDKGRAAAITSRYFTLDTNWFTIDQCAVACHVEAEPYTNKKGEQAGYILKSPQINTLASSRGLLLLSTHPELGGDLKIITPDANPRLGYMTVKSINDPHNLPYHFRISILPHGHMLG